MDEPDFLGALNEEFGLTPEPDNSSSTSPTADASADDKGGEAEQAPAAVAEEQVPADKAEPATPQGVDAIPTAEEKATADAEAAAGAEAAKAMTKEDVIDAMREYNEQTTGRISQIHEARDEIISKLHPEGIDQNIYDTEGNVIKTAQDIVDRGLVNERTGDAFTYEEAASFMLQAQQQMAKNVEELNQWADNVAEQNISLLESNQRVMSEWGDVLKAMPNIANQLAERYVTTQIKFDKTGSYITEMHMSPEDFYALTLSPYKQLGEAMAKQEAQAAQTQQVEQQNEQSERMGLPQRGQSATRSNTGDDMLDALIDEMNKG